MLHSTEAFQKDIQTTELHTVILQIQCDFDVYIN